MLVAQTTRDHGGLFRLKITINLYTVKVQVSETVPELNVDIWHQRLRHLNEDYIRKLVGTENGIGIKFRTTVGVFEAYMKEK